MTETMRLVRSQRYRRYATMTLVAVLFSAVSFALSWLLGQRFEQVQWRIDAPVVLQQRIEDAMQAMKLNGLWDARPAAIQRELTLRVPDIDRLEVSRTLPGSLQITATNRRVVALWESPNGRVMLVDEHGKPYRALARGEVADFPLLRVDAPHLPAACNLLIGMQQARSPWLMALSEMMADLDGWRLNLSAGQQWLIPFGKKSLQSVTEITLLLQQPRWHTGIWRIDARQQNRWFVRPAKSQGVI
jgi:cell division septal protein FtsQ